MRRRRRIVLPGKDGAMEKETCGGLVHLYCGDGKGKTTAGMGLCLRAAGAGQKVLIFQFLKDNRSSERAALAAVPGGSVFNSMVSLGRTAGKAGPHARAGAGRPAAL